jgi:hypothetical protein
MLRNYKSAIDWRNATGRGVEEVGGTIEAELNRRCSRFAELDAIFGTRPNMNPPALWSSLASGGEPEDVAAMLEDGLSATDETSDHESVTASDSHRNPRRVSSSASSPQSRRGKPTVFDVVFSTMDTRLEIDAKRLEMQPVAQQRQAEMQQRQVEMQQRQVEIQQRKLEMEC